MSEVATFASSMASLSKGLLRSMMSMAWPAAASIVSIPPFSISLTSFVLMRMNSSMLTPYWPWMLALWHTKAPSLPHSASRGECLNS